MSPEIVNITSPETLGAYLARFGISVKEWGKGATKTVGHLLSEIQNGDCELVEEESGLIRRVHNVNISVSAEFNGKSHTLIEDRQVFNEGTSRESIRSRHLGGAVSEKIHSSENPGDAVSRAIREELGIEGDITVNETRPEEDVDMDSPSFPGLRTQYRVYHYHATLVGDQIHKEGYKEVQPDKTTYFVWKDAT